MAAVEAEQEVLPEEVNPFQVEEGLTPLEAVLRYSAESAHLLQRISYICSIPAVAADGDPGDAATILVPLLVQLSFDDDPEVKHAAAQVIAPLAQVLHAAGLPAQPEQPAGQEWEQGQPTGPEAVNRFQEEVVELLVVAQRLLHDPETLVQETAEVAVAGLAPLLTPAQRASQLASVLASVCDEAGDEELSECGARLLVRLVGDAGLAAQDPGWCQRAVLPRLLALSQHPSYGVRVELAGAVPPLLAALPDWQRGDVLLPVFSKLCTDPVWSVRQEAAGEFAAVAQHLTREEMRGVVLPLYRRVLGDVSAWVKASARRHAGALLAAMHPDDAAPDLVEAFVATTGETATLSEAAARALPAVLRTLGPGRWRELAPAAATLASSEYVTVRAALADAMASLAASLAPADVEADILPLLQRLSSDPHPAVTDALALNIRPLLAALPPHARADQLGFLARLRPESSSACGQWRARLLVADQLAGLAELVGGSGGSRGGASTVADAAPGAQQEQQAQQGPSSGHVLLDLILPAALQLCCDPVAEVRGAAAAQLGQMVAAWQSSSAGGSSGNGSGPSAAGSGDGQAASGAAAAAAEQAVSTALEWQRAQSHRQRQTFVAFCTALLLLPATLAGSEAQAGAAMLLAHPLALDSAPAARLLPALLQLAGDRVPNVRLAAARLLARLQAAAAASSSGGSSGGEEIAAALSRLAADADVDVRQAAATAEPSGPATGAPPPKAVGQGSGDAARVKDSAQAAEGEAAAAEEEHQAGGAAAGQPKASPRSFPLTDA